MLDKKGKATDVEYERIKNNEKSDSEVDEDKDVEKCQTKGKSKDGGKWTTRMKLLLLAGCIVSFITYGSISLITPYFPLVGEKMGLSRSVIGVLFSTAALMGVIVSPLTGYVITLVEPKYVMFGGLLVAAITQFLFGLGIKLPPGTPFLAWSFVFRLVTAAGAISSCTALLAILPQEFSNDYGTALGVTELFSGLGLAGAPAISGVIYYRFGYVWPPAISAFLMAASAISLVCLFWGQSFQGPKQEEGFFETAFQLVKKPQVLIGVESTFIGSMSFTVLEPIYSLFGRKVLHLNTWQIGTLYIVVWVGYLFSTLVVGKLVDKYGKHLVLLILGFLLGAVGFLLMGPDPQLGMLLPSGTIWLTVIAEACIGLGLGAAYIPPLPFMVDAIKNESKTDFVTSSILSSLFFSSVSLGVFVGPLLSGILADHVTLRQTLAIFGYTVGAQGFLLLLYLLFSTYCGTR